MTAELPLEPASTAVEIKNYVDVLDGVVDAVQIPDDRAARGQMSGVAAASLVLRQGVDAVLHLSCRDRNRIALQADLLGAAALGVTSVVLLRGKKLPKSDAQRAKGVFELDTEKLMSIARVIGEERALVPPPGLFLGSSVSVFVPDDTWHAKRAFAKLDSGARFLQSQPCLDVGPVGQYVARLIDQKITHRASIIIDVPLLASTREAQLLTELQPGTLIGEAVVKRLSESKDPLAYGIDVCSTVVTALRDMPGVSGVNIRHNGDPKNVCAALQRAGVVD